MKHVIVALLGTTALGVSIANAADMPTKAPVAVFAPYNWTGWYVGGNIGYGWGRGATDVNPLPSAATFVNLLPQTLDASPKGILGGAQFGYNWQSGSMVLGVEFDFQGADINGTVVQSPIIQNNGTPFPGAGNNITISQKLDWFGTARLRAGTTFVDPRLLVFVTGGLAYGHVSGSAVTSFPPVGTTIYAADTGHTKAGWVIGGGAEWALANNWSVKAEYLHVDLGSKSVTANPQFLFPPFQVNYVSHTAVDIARVGLNFKFH